MNTKLKLCVFSRHFCKKFILLVDQRYHYQKGSSSSLSSRIRKQINSKEMERHFLDMATGTQERSSVNAPKSVVSIEGNIGSGKTEMLNYFQTISDCEVLEEPVAKWRNVRGSNPLELMYTNPERWGMTLQTFIQLTMLENHLKPQVKPVRLMERSIYSAKYCFIENLFKSGKMLEIEYLILSEWYEWIIKTQNVQLHKIVYLQTDPEILHERIKKRNRPEEADISLEYLKSIHQFHEDWLVHKKSYCPADVLIIDANSALEEMPELYEQHRSSIVQTR